jgi:hypothetical protein
MLPIMKAIWLMVVETRNIVAHHGAMFNLQRPLAAYLAAPACQEEVGQNPCHSFLRSLFPQSSGAACYNTLFNDIKIAMLIGSWHSLRKCIGSPRSRIVEAHGSGPLRQQQILTSSQHNVINRRTKECQSWHEIRDLYHELKDIMDPIHVSAMLSVLAKTAPSNHEQSEEMS